jgi:Superfamily I DNA and RNA helicases
MTGGTDFLKGLSAVQCAAVKAHKGPSLIVAGAGSGKTRVLTCRIAQLLQSGVPAASILALTFTNKAAKEMRSRIQTMVGERGVYGLWMGTFHSVFSRILRREADLLGFPKHFTIYDKADSRSALKACIKELELDDKVYVAGDVQSRISMAKNNLISAAAYVGNAALLSEDAAVRKPRISDIYQLYSRKCRQAGAMDFDDLLLYTNVLFRDFPEVLQKYCAQFSHILVDEYQDTNFAQYLIVKKLAQGHRNLCVVGDDAQSIYAFRGARIENILNFRRDFPEAGEYKLEQNYRSTQTIVNAANSLIRHNSEQLHKECFSQAEQGEKIELLSAYTDQEESYMVVASLLARKYARHAAYDDFAILYRTNAQSRSLEEALRKRNIPHKIYGGTSFYERAEIKDMMAYLRLAVNPKDDEAFKRIVNVPARGIGDTTLVRLQAAALARGSSLWEQVGTEDLSAFELKPSAIAKLRGFTDMVQDMGAQQFVLSAFDFARAIGKRSGYLSALEEDRSIEGKARLENVEEFFNSIKEFEQRDEDAPFSEDEVDGQLRIHHFLANVALLTQADEDEDDKEPKVKLMTLHQSKGLEFSFVYIVGLEENLFPGTLAAGSLKELEEERRLFYVGLTRAKQAVSLSYAKSRFRWGTVTHNSPSRFLKEVEPCWLAQPLQEKSDKENPRELFESRQGFGRFGGRPSGQQTGMRQSASSGLSLGAVGAPKTKSLVQLDSQSATPSSQPSVFSAGQRVAHERFGQGTIISVEGGEKAVVAFDAHGTKTLLLKFAKMQTLS